MAGVKGKSGRRKLPINEIREWMDAHKTVAVPAAYNALLKRVRQGDRDASKYMLDRFLGTPHQSIDHRVKGTLVLTADEYELASRAVLESEGQVLEGSSKLIESTPKLEAGNPEATGAEIERCANQTEANFDQVSSSPDGQIQKYNDSEQPDSDILRNS